MKPRVFITHRVHDSVLAKLDAASKRRATVQAFMSDRLVEEAEATARLAFDEIVSSNDETQLDLYEKLGEEKYGQLQAKPADAAE